MDITISGKVQEAYIQEILKNSGLTKILEDKVNDKINGIVNKHFNAENTTQLIRENFNKSVSRLASTDEFKDLLKEVLTEKVKSILDEKDFTKVINDSCKTYIDNIIKTVKA